MKRRKRTVTIGIVLVACGGMAFLNGRTRGFHPLLSALERDEMATAALVDFSGGADSRGHQEVFLMLLGEQPSDALVEGLLTRGLRSRPFSGNSLLSDQYLVEVEKVARWWPGRATVDVSIFGGIDSVRRRHFLVRNDGRWVVQSSEPL